MADQPAAVVALVDEIAGLQLVDGHWTARMRRSRKQPSGCRSYYLDRARILASPAASPGNRFGHDYVRVASDTGHGVDWAARFAGDFPAARVKEATAMARDGGPWPHGGSEEAAHLLHRLGFSGQYTGQWRGDGDWANETVTAETRSSRAVISRITVTAPRWSCHLSGMPPMALLSVIATAALSATPVQAS